MRLRDRLVHQRVRFTGATARRTTGARRARPAAWRPTEPVGQPGEVAPDVGPLDVLVDQLVGGHTGPGRRARPDAAGSRRPCPRPGCVVRRGGAGPEQPGRLAEHAPHLGAAVGHVPLRQGIADLLDPDRGREPGERGRRRAFDEGRSPATPPSCQICAPGTACAARNRRGRLSLIARVWDVSAEAGSGDDVGDADANCGEAFLYE